MSDQRTRLQVGAWRNELIDLSLRNRLLNFPRRLRTAVEVVSPGIGTVLDGLQTLPRGWRFHYPPQDDVADDEAVMLALENEDPDLTEDVQTDELLTAHERATELSRALHNLSRRASQEFLDKGLQVLYLAVGMLEWRDADIELSSPVLLLPVSLERRSPREPFRLVASEEDPVVNPALAVKLDKDYGVQLPELDPDDTDFVGFLASVDNALRSRDGWRTSPRLVLSVFSFHKEAMYRDLLVNEATICQHALVQALAAGEDESSAFGFEPVEEDELDRVAPPESMVSILDADSTQRRCVVAARDGRSFVMDGPPGTGKSQTIANAIAELMHAGKSVLFVSEKAAALEVVKSRLDTVGLGHFVLELHSHKATRKEVAAQLGQALKSRPRPPRVMDAASLRRVAEYRVQLSEYAVAVNELRRPLGLSLFAAIGRCCALEQVPHLPTPDGIRVDLSVEQFVSIVDAARRLSVAWAPVAKSDAFLWRDLNEPEIAAARIAEIASSAEETIDALGEVQRLSDAVSEQFGLPAATTVDDVRWLCRLTDLLSEPHNVPSAWLSSEDFDGVTRAVQKVASTVSRWVDLVERLDCAAPGWRQLDRGTIQHLLVCDKALRESDPPFSPSPQSPLPVVETASFVGKEWAGRINRLETEALALGEMLGVPLSPNPTVADVRTIGELGCLAGATHPPEARWLGAAGLAQARAAVNALRPLVTQHRAVAAEVAECFTDALLDIDVESFFADGASPQLSRLSSVGRRNRRALEGCVKDGKINSRVESVLVKARHWQQVRRALDMAEAEHAHTLGAHYYSQRDNADLDAIDDALGIAERALSLAGTTPIPERLSRTSSSRTETFTHAAAVVAELEAWVIAAKQICPNALPRLFAYPLRHQAALIDWLRPVLTGYAEALRSLATVAATGATVSQLVEIASRVDELMSLEVELNGRAAADAELIGPLYRGTDTDWREVERAFEWSANLRRLMPRRIHETLAQLLVDAGPQADISLAVQHLDKCLGTVWESFELRQTERLRADFNVSLEAGDQLLTELLESVGDIVEWSSFCRDRDTLLRLGCGATLGAAEQRRIPAAELPDAIERTVLVSWVEAIISTDQRLRPLLAPQRDQLVDEFRALDNALRQHAIGRVIETCTARRPTVIAGAASVIVREAEKKKKHMPIRNLLHATGPVAIACKPCFMMSPLSVSQFLPPELVFDVVIFDEASQVRPCDAINAIYRGRQTVIAGDERQLPPTSFFDRINSDGDDSWSEEQLLDYESVLKAAKGSGIPSLPLTWHYRSRHESLITYSNYQFYNGELVTYPAALREAADLGVSFIHVSDGCYSRGGARDNPIEAKTVVQRVVYFAEHHADLTVGVVAFSEAQAQRIERELEYVRRDRPDLDSWFSENRLDGFFIKNLESVQGDERDVIILSVGYGPDEAGRITMNFGPLNVSGGERRLNVAITRARQRVEVVSSVVGADIIETPSVGVRHLKRFLEYAERGIDALALDLAESVGDAESPFEETVLATVRGWGYDASPQVGQAGYRIDIGVRHPARPGKFVLGIECDGAAYHSSRVARDRDRLRHDVLTNLGWNLHRIWGPAWYRNRVAEEERLRQAIEAAITGERSRPVVASRPRVIEVESVEFTEGADWAIPYAVSSLTVSGRFRMDDPASASELVRLILRIVESEGPISRRLLVDRARSAAGANRMGDRMQQGFDRALKILVRRGDVHEIEPSFYAPAGGEVRVRIPNDDARSRRDAKDVPRGELKLALFRFVCDAHAISADELSTRVARLFGWGRRGSEISAFLGAALDELQAEGLVQRASNGLITVSAPEEC